MVFVTDQDNGLVFSRKFKSFKVNFGDERASCVNDSERACLGLIADRGRNSVCAEDENGAVWNFFDGFDENGAAAAELLHYISIVDNFMVDVDRITISFESEFHDVHGADYAGTKAAGTYAQKHFSIGFGRHLLPNLVVYQHSIIPQGQLSPHRNSLFLGKHRTIRY
jgi:myo-inositol-hexaphosphate 3-phosphohydrolase